MYNGIGLTTPRGSGTNGHVQRNWAFVRPGKKDNSSYRSEEDIKKLDAALNRPPNKDILDHDRKRKIEVKCLEFEEILEKQGLSSDDIKTKVESYRKKLIGQVKTDIPKDEFGRIAARDSHQIAEAQQEKNAKLREAFNISEYFVEGSSFDSDRKAKEDLAKSLALQKELDTQRDQTAAAAAKEASKHHILERTPSMEHDMTTGGAVAGNGDNTIKKKKKKKSRDSSNSPERKKDKKKKSKKRKKESKSKKSKKLRKRKISESESNADIYQESVDEDSASEVRRKKSKRDKKKRRNKKKEASSSSDKSRTMSPGGKVIDRKKNVICIKKKKSFDDEVLRSRSNEKSHKSGELHKHRHESSRYSRSRRSHSRNDKSEAKQYSSSRDNKSVSGRHGSGSLNKKSEHRCSRDYRSRECSDTDYKSRDRESRSWRSRKTSKHEIADECTKSLKRKRYGEYSESTRDSPNIEKRKRYSRSHSPTFTRQARDKKSLAKPTEIKKHLPRARSRTPRYKLPDNQKKYKSRSRSSSRRKSLTPPLLTPKKNETRKCETNAFDRSESTGFTFNSKKLAGSKPRSRHTSTSSSDITSSIDKSISNRSSSLKKGRLQKQPVYKSIDSQKVVEKEIKSPSPIRTPTSVRRRSMSVSTFGHVIHEKSTKDKRDFNLRSEDCVEKSREKVEKTTLSPRSSRDSSELSYSPARRNPERYRDILEKNRTHKTENFKTSDRDEDRKEITKLLKQSEERDCDRKEKVNKNDRNQANPVVRLQSQSDEDSDTLGRNNEKILDEFQEFKREKELKDLKMLEQLKTDIAAKAKEKIKTIEKMAASTSGNSSTNNDEEVSEKSYKHTVRNSLNEFLAANNVAPAVVASCSTIIYNSTPNTPPGAIYPQTLEEIEKEQESILQLTDTSIQLENKNVNSNMDTEPHIICKKSLVTANGHAPLLSPTASPTHNNVNVMNKERDRKRERDIRERERERETNYFNKERYLERRQRSSPNFYSSGGVSNNVTTVSGNIGGKRNNNGNIMNANNRQQRLNLMYNSGGVGSHHHPHPHLHPNYHHPNHKIINNHHSSSSSSSTIYIANNSSTNPHALMCNHGNNSTNISFNRPSRINNTPLITATQFNNQMLSKQSNSILVNRRDHRTALNLGLSGTPCTNFSNSNLLLTKANTNPHHLRAATLGHVGGGGHHHQYHHHHHHHHHGQSASMSSGGNNTTTQITDRILMAASIAAARHSLGVHCAASSASAVAAANNLSFLQQQNKQKLVIKPFKINDSQPLVAALADSSLVDAIVSKVSTATVAAAESAARRSRSRSRRSRSRNRHDEKRSIGGSGGAEERDGSRHHSTSHSRSSRSSTSSRSRSRSHSHRTTRSHSSQSSSSSHTSSRSSSSSSFGSSRSGTRSPSIPRRRGSPSFLDRRRITSARKRPIPYHRKLPSDVSSCYCSSCCSGYSSPRSRSPSRDSRSPSGFF